MRLVNNLLDILITQEPVTCKVRVLGADQCPLFIAPTLKLVLQNQSLGLGASQHTITSQLGRRCWGLKDVHKAADACSVFLSEKANCIFRVCTATPGAAPTVRAIGQIWDSCSHSINGSCSPSKLSSSSATSFILFLIYHGNPGQSGFG